MKKSSIIELVLVAGITSSCNHQKAEPAKRLFVRGDSTSQYTASQRGHTGHYVHFYPYGYFGGSGYSHAGYESGSISGKATSGSVSRGGFGYSGFRVGS
ncbi:hypothetical protein [Parabacteroides sp. FAFU027]|uniref:hypothetical protein n=1 Tax=Parabacteroides sp. FAFU027 TaxID=2922715 RepID=UPI001FAF2EAE|nr:hypothetical protein [Parabacteroides sp. FAFU027]